MSRKHRHREKRKDQEVSYKYFYGIPHAHTGYSTGKGTPEEALHHTKSKGLHYLIITDHNRYLHRLVKGKKKEIDKWNYLKKTMQRFNKKNKYFLGIHGFELKIKNIGDLNIVNSKTHIRGAIKDLDKLMEWIKEENCIGIINHPGPSMEKIKHNIELNKYITLMEVGNGSPPFKYTRYFKYYYRLLDAGWKLGAVNGQDNHSDNWGESSNLTVILSEKLSSKCLIEALSERRTYSTESRSLKLVYKVNEVWMGGNIESEVGKNLNFLICVEDIEIPIEKVEVISRGGRIIKEFQCNMEHKLKFEFNTPVSHEENWYVIKIIQHNDKIAISSPVFILIKKEI